MESTLYYLLVISYIHTHACVRAHTHTQGISVHTNEAEAPNWPDLDDRTPTGPVERSDWPRRLNQ